MKLLFSTITFLTSSIHGKVAGRADTGHVILRQAARLLIEGNSFVRPVLPLIYHLISTVAIYNHKRNMCIQA